MISRTIPPPCWSTASPKDGYASVAFAALDNINANTPDASMAKKLATLTAPFICLDGMNAKRRFYRRSHAGQ